jgi:hypothetical protein
MERHRLLGDELEQFGQQPTLTFFVLLLYSRSPRSAYSPSARC